jgi:hypothetical protein
VLGLEREIMAVVVIAVVVVGVPVVAARQAGRACAQRNAGPDAGNRRFRW